MHILFKVKNEKGTIQIIGNENIDIPAGEEKQGQFFVFLNHKDLKEKKSDIEISIIDSSAEIKTITTTFMAPIE